VHVFAGTETRVFLHGITVGDVLRILRVPAGNLRNRVTIDQLLVFHADVVPPGEWDLCPLYFPQGSSGPFGAMLGTTSALFSPRYARIPSPTTLTFFLNDLIGRRTLTNAVNREMDAHLHIPALFDKMIINAVNQMHNTRVSVDGPETQSPGLIKTTQLHLGDNDVTIRLIY